LFSAPQVRQGAGDRRVSLWESIVALILPRIVLTLPAVAVIVLAGWQLLAPRLEQHFGGHAETSVERAYHRQA
jgi:hypothetical protein